MSHGVLPCPYLADCVLRINHKDDFLEVPVVTIAVNSKLLDDCSIVVSEVGDDISCLRTVTAGIAGQVHGHTCRLAISITRDDGGLETESNGLSQDSTDVLVNPNRSKAEVEPHEILRDCEVSRVLIRGHVNDGNLTCNLLADSSTDRSPGTELAGHLNAVHNKLGCTCSVCDVDGIKQRVILLHILDYSIDYCRRDSRTDIGDGLLCTCLNSSDELLVPAVLLRCETP